MNILGLLYLIPMVTKMFMQKNSFLWKVRDVLYFIKLDWLREEIIILSFCFWTHESQIKNTKETEHQIPYLRIKTPPFVFL